MSLIHAYKNRGMTFDFTITGVETVGANDKLRATIGREGRLGTETDNIYADAELCFTSDAATANGSSITPNGGTETGSHRLRLDAADLDFDPGVYTLLIDLLDVADASDWKNVSRQVFSLEST